MIVRYNFYAVLCAALLLGACSKERPFSPDTPEEGKVLKSALDVSASNDNIEISKSPTRAGFNLNDFNIAFIKPGNSTPVKSFTYGEMPDIVNLAAGSYTVEASYGENRIAEWENPFFQGVSEPFEVVPMEITSYIEPIECSLQNIKVTIEFDAALYSKMGSDAYVEVKVGDNDGLNFTKSESRAGYFRHTDENSLVATFHGNIDGSNIVETKSYSDVQKGCWYKLKFKLHGGSASGTGAASGDLSVDANVDVEDVNEDIVLADDQPLDDDERPSDGDEQPDPPTEQPPVFTADPQSPGLVFDTEWAVNENTNCKFSITSSAPGGFIELTCDIISKKLNPQELAGVGLGSHLDLINTDESGMAEALANLGFPVNMGGKKEAVFDITQFMPMMLMLGDGKHEFKIHVKDAYGEVTKSLILKFGSGDE
ncbi:MAG: DUF4493 domain-containing protein [Muribaculaceae bacterium]|nr:DUF4493 domain-containing protein [Muribaculaceae bacterium]